MPKKLGYTVLSGFILVMIVRRFGLHKLFFGKCSSVISNIRHRYINLLSKEALSNRYKQQFRNEQQLLKKSSILEDVEEWQRHLKNVMLNKGTKISTIVKQSPLIENVNDENDENIYNNLPYVAGSDISFIKGNKEDACVALVVLKLPNLEVVYEDISMVKITVPYVPGFLAFREASHIVEKVKKLRLTRPEFNPLALMLDGNGTLHEYEFGLACHVGVLLDMVTVGIGKTPYVASHLKYNDAEVLKDKISVLKNVGDIFPLVTTTGKVLGVAYRSSLESTNPVYISPGHKISMETAVDLVRLCCKYRVPEPIRQADMKSRQYLRDHCMT